MGIIYFFGGTIICELIILFYASIFATSEEKEKAREISQRTVCDIKVPPIPLLTMPIYESAAATGPYSIMPVRIIGWFMLIWYIIIPVIWLIYKLLTAPPKFQELWNLGMKAIVGY